MKFLKAPNLKCIEATHESLTFRQWGSNLIYVSDRSDLAFDLVRYLSSPRTKKDILSFLKHAPKGIVLEELEKLMSLKIIFEYHDNASPKNAINPTVLQIFDNAPVNYFERVLNKRVCILDLTGRAIDLSRILREIGLRNISSSRIGPRAKNLQFKNSDADLTVILSFQGQEEALSMIGKENLRRHKRWLLIVVDDFGGIVGPQFGVEGGPCFECMRTEFQKTLGAQISKVDCGDLFNVTEAKRLGPINRGILSFAVVEIIKILSNLVTTKTSDGFFSFDLFNFRMEYTSIRPSPDCRICFGSRALNL